MTPSPVVPYASIQFANAVPDTGEMDFRVVDIASNAGLFDAVFRDVDSFPQPIEAGARRIRVFMSSVTDQSVASDVVWDTVFTFAQNERYTFTLDGYARTGQTPALRAVIEQKTAVPAPVTARVHVRVRNLAPTNSPYADGAVDVWFAPRGAAALTGTPKFTNVAFGDLTAYDTVTTGTYKLAVTATGTTSPILFQSNVPPGVAASGTGSGIAGTNVAGSGLTIVLTARSIDGSGAPFSFTALNEFTSITTAGTTFVDTIATAVTAAPHGLTTSDTVVINGAGDTLTALPAVLTSGYNGTFRVLEVVDANTFRYKISSSRVRSSTASGHPHWFRARFAPSFNGRAIGRLTSVGTTATVLSIGGHGLVTNDIAVIRGAADAAYNGTFAVTVVNTTTFTYTTDVAPTASPATGTPVFRPGLVDFTGPNLVILTDRRP